MITIAKSKLNSEKYADKYHEQRFDCIQLFQRGIYYLYDGLELVYIGQSKYNIMDRILKHYNNKDKNFDSFKIFIYKNLTDFELNEVEKKRIKKHNPKYNIIHNDNISVSNIDYEISKKIKEECWHTFIPIKDKNYVMCSKCGFKQLLPNKVKERLYKK